MRIGCPCAGRCAPVPLSTATARRGPACTESERRERAPRPAAQPPLARQVALSPSLSQGPCPTADFPHGDQTCATIPCLLVTLRDRSSTTTIYVSGTRRLTII
eukprot:114065-Prymnesium_polylepis.1